MKNIAIILSLYLLTLIALPCIDVQKDIAKHQVELSQQNQDEHHHSDADHCSPFCTCNCCATSLIIQEYIVQSNSFSYHEKQYFPVSSFSFSDPLASIWQPPKIS